MGRMDGANVQVAALAAAGIAGGLFLLWRGFGGYRTAMRITAALCVVGAAVAAATIRTARPVAPTTQASVLQPCHEPCRATGDGEHGQTALSSSRAAT